MAAKLSNNTSPFLLSWHKTQYFLRDPPISNMLLNCLLNWLRLDCQMCCSQLIPPLAYPWWLNCLTACNAPTHPPILTQTWAWTFLAAEAWLPEQVTLVPSFDMVVMWERCTTDRLALSPTLVHIWSRASCSFSSSLSLLIPTRPTSSQTHPSQASMYTSPTLSVALNIDPNEDLTSTILV